MSAIYAITLEEIGGIVSAHDFLDVIESRVSDFTIKINRLKYTGPLGNPNSLKVEIDYAQNVVLPACEREYRDLYGVRPTVRIMDLREMLAEKIRAASGRARYRDFYDIAMIMDSHKMDIGEVLGLVRRKEIRETISQKSMLRNWEIAKQEKGEGVDIIVYTKDVSNENILKAIKSIGPFEIKKTQ